MKKINRKINFYDIEWILLLFGTSIGAGILFLPLQAAISGLIPLVIASILIFPVIYFAEKNLASFVLEEVENLKITDIFSKQLGHKFALFSTIIYFLSCYTVIIAYANSLPATLSSALTLYFSASPELASKPWFSFIVLLIPVLIMISKREFMLKIITIIIYPLIICLLFISCFLIQYWKIDNIHLGELTFTGIFCGFLTIFPILVFAMNYSQSISQMIFYYKEHNTEKNEIVLKTKRNIYLGTMLIVFFTLFFIYSSILAIPAEKIKSAIKQLKKFPVYLFFFHFGQLQSSILVY